MKVRGISSIDSDGLWVSILCLALITGAFATVAAVFGEPLVGSIVFFVWDVLLLGALGMIGAMALVSWCICATRKRWRSSRAAQLSRRAALTLLPLACICIAAWGLHLLVARARLERGKDWLIARVPAIEEYKRERGTYPPSLDDVVDLRAGPSILRDGYLRYSGDTHDFSFDFSTGLLSGWCWNSETKRWDHYD